MADVDDRGSVGDEEGGKDLWYLDQKCLCIKVKFEQIVIMVPVCYFCSAGRRF